MREAERIARMQQPGIRACVLGASVGAALLPGRQSRRGCVVFGAQWLVEQSKSKVWAYVASKPRVLRASSTFCLSKREKELD